MGQSPIKILKKVSQNLKFPNPFVANAWVLGCSGCLSTWIFSFFLFLKLARSTHNIFHSTELWHPQKWFDKCNFYMIFIILLFIKIVSFPLFLLIWLDFYLYLSIHLCFEGMRRFLINLQRLYMQSGARPIESTQLTSSQAWIQEKTNAIKFKSNWSEESKEIYTKSKSNLD